MLKQLIGYSGTFLAFVVLGLVHLSPAVSASMPPPSGHGDHGAISCQVACQATPQRQEDKLNSEDNEKDDEKRQILIELFENIVFKNYAVSVSLKDRAELIAKYSSKTRELLGTQKSNDRTFTNSENNRGQNNEKSAENALYPLWQG